MAPVGGQRRKVVTVVFADVVGSTALGERVDPETLRWAMQRWFGRMRDVVERHGGTVENYIGDAVMAVFGIPVAHEDDALRAVRAAAEMREEVAALRGELRRERGVELAVRIGVNTGEAVTGAAASGGSFTAGDTVNVAARLEQAARPGDILLGRDTFRLVRHAVDAEPVAPLTVKGKRAALEAFRLLAVAPDARGRAAAAARADGRPPARAAPAARRLPSGGRGSLVPAVHRARRRRRRQVAPRRRGPGDDRRRGDRRGRPLPALRRRADLVAARRGARAERAARAGGGRRRAPRPRARPSC